MEHDLFWSKLKPSVDRTLLSNIIGNSCSGKHSPYGGHGAGPIQERLKKMLMKVNDAPQLDPTTQHQGNEALTPQPPAPTSQPSSQLTSNPVVVSASANTDAPQSPSTFSDTRKKIKGVRRKVPAESGTTNSSSAHTVDLVCSHCSATIPLARDDSIPFA